MLRYGRQKKSLRGKMVGTTGFEPATSRTPSVRATRLRYVPTVFVARVFRRGGYTRLGEKPSSRLNRDELQGLQRITRVREASRMSGANRAGRATFCGSGPQEGARRAFFLSGFRLRFERFAHIPQRERSM